LTLDELLALLPDNTTGEIAAADMRTIVTELWNYTVEVQGDLNTAAVTAANEATAAQATAQSAYTSLDQRVSALEGGSVTPTYQASGRWQINPQPGTPGGMQVSADQASWASASVLRFSITDQDNENVRNVLMNASEVWGQMAQDDQQWGRWDITGAAVDHDTYVEQPVSFVSGAGSIATAGWQSGIFVFTVSAPLGLTG
jgi:hypothetical protein